MPLKFSITTLGVYPTNKTNKPNPLNIVATTTWYWHQSIPHCHAGLLPFFISCFAFATRYPVSHGCPLWDCFYMKPRHVVYRLLVVPDCQTGSRFTYYGSKQPQPNQRLGLVVRSSW